MKFSKKTLLISAVTMIPLAFASMNASATGAAATPDKAVAATSGATHASKMDTNGDKVIDKAEYDAHNKARFDKMDTNKDGKISADEMKAAKAKKGGKGHQHKKDETKK